MLVVILLAAVMVGVRGPRRKLLRQSSAATVPILLLGLPPTVLVMPMLYYFSELAAGLGFLFALALGGLVWAISTMPSAVRVDERALTRARSGPIEPAGSAGLSVVVPTRNGEAVLAESLTALADRLGADDELVVVENGSTRRRQRPAGVDRVRLAARGPARRAPQRPRAGQRRRTGVLASRGTRVLLTADDVPFGFSDLDGFAGLPDEAVVAVGSKAHPASEVDRAWRREAQSRAFRWLRRALLHSAVGDSQGTIWVDGAWARSFALGVARDGPDVDGGARARRRAAGDRRLGGAGAAQRRPRHPREPVPGARRPHRRTRDHEPRRSARTTTPGRSGRARTGDVPAVSRVALTSFYPVGTRSRSLDPRCSTHHPCAPATRRTRPKFQAVSCADPQF